jgi:hypothetical protein
MVVGKWCISKSIETFIISQQNKKRDNIEDDQELSDDVYQEGEFVGVNMVLVDKANVETFTRLLRNDATIAIDELYI